jgi:hypothetical protein
MTPPLASPIWQLALILAVACSSAGCSLAFVNGPPPNHEKIAYFDCSTSNALPTIDLLFAGAATVDAIGGAAGASGLPSNRAELAVFGAEAAVFAASAIYGYGKTAECRKAQSDMLKRAALSPTFAFPSGYAPAPTRPGFAPPPIAPQTAPQTAPYDPWVAPPPPAMAAPAGLTPVGPLPPTAPTVAPIPVPATDGETPGSGSATPPARKAVQ